MLQEILLAAYKAYGSLADKTKFKSRLFSIAAHKVNDFHRNKAKINEVSPDTDIASKSAENKTVSAVRETLMMLDDRQADVLRRKFLYGETVTEISSALGIPAGTVKSRINNAKRKFKSIYPYSYRQRKTENREKRPASSHGRKELSMTRTEYLELLPEYTLTPLNEEAKALTCYEVNGWFIIPRLNESASFAYYDYSTKRLDGDIFISVTGGATVHCISTGVKAEIIERNYQPGENDPSRSRDNYFEQKRTLVYAANDDFIRPLAQWHYEGDDICLSTYLDDGFNTAW